MTLHAKAAKCILLNEMYSWGMDSIHVSKCRVQRTGSDDPSYALVPLLWQRYIVMSYFQAITLLSCLSPCWTFFIKKIPLLTIALETVLPPASFPPLTPPFELPRDIWQIVMEFFYRQSAKGWCMAPISVAGAPAAAESLLVQPQPWEPRTKTWWGGLFNSI